MTRATDIEEQAARWLIRLDAGGNESRGPLVAEFEAWANSDLRHRAAYLRLSTAWAKSGRLRSLVSPGAAVDPDFLMRGRPRRAWFGPLRLGALAVSLVVATLVGWWQFRPMTTTYWTDVGAFARVPLPDGSVIALNTDSEIRVRLSRSLREVTLIRGEATFDVAHDRRRPFDVHVDSAVVRAVGTSFDVRRLDGQAVGVIVTEGRVTLNMPSSMHPQGGTDQGPVSLVAGEAATSRAGRMEVRKIDSGETARRLAWQGGQLVFQGETLAEALGEFNRYSRRQLVLADPGLGGLRVGGNFKTTDIDSFAAALRASFGLRVEAEGASTVRIRKGPDVEPSVLSAPVIKK